MKRNEDTVWLMNQVADQIEQHPEQYDQSVWFYPKGSCGTICCIAGWTVKIAMPERWAEFEANGVDEWGEVVGRYDDYIRVKATELLGLEIGKSETYLFSTGWKPANDMTVSEALRKFAGGEDIQDVTYPNYIGRSI